MYSGRWKAGACGQDQLIIPIRRTYIRAECSGSFTFWLWAKELITGNIARSGENERVSVTSFDKSLTCSDVPVWSAAQSLTLPKNSRLDFLNYSLNSGSSSTLEQYDTVCAMINSDKYDEDSFTHRERELFTAYVPTARTELRIMPLSQFIQPATKMTRWENFFNDQELCITRTSNSFRARLKATQHP